MYVSVFNCAKLISCLCEERLLAFLSHVFDCCWSKVCLNLSTCNSKVQWILKFKRNFPDLFPHFKGQGYLCVQVLSIFCMCFWDVDVWKWDRFVWCQKDSMVCSDDVCCISFEISVKFVIMGWQHSEVKNINIAVSFSFFFFHRFFVWQSPYFDPKNALL